MEPGGTIGTHVPAFIHATLFYGKHDGKPVSVITRSGLMIYIYYTTTFLCVNIFVCLVLMYYNYLHEKICNTDGCSKRPGDDMDQSRVHCHADCRVGEEPGMERVGGERKADIYAESKGRVC